MLNNSKPSEHIPQMTKNKRLDFNSRKKQIYLYSLISPYYLIFTSFSYSPITSKSTRTPLQGNIKKISSQREKSEFKKYWFLFLN